MTRYILWRLVSAIPVLLGISVIVFLIMAMIPGDPATAILGSYATADNIARLNRELGLDRPLVQRYFIWLGNMLQGDFGRSLSLNRPVLDEITERFNATLILAGVSFVLCSVLGVVAGAVSGARQYGFADRAITFVVLLGISIPSFFLGMMMIMAFAVNLRWFPASGMWPTYGARTLSAPERHEAELPDPLHPSQGCAFRARCPRAIARCAVDDPALATGAGGVQVACFNPL